jgi:hypothetical protein
MHQSSLLASKRAQRDLVSAGVCEKHIVHEVKKPEFKRKISTAMIHELED